MTFEPVIVRPQFAALSTAGRRMVMAAGPWFFGVLFGASAAGLIGPDDPLAQRWLVATLALAPVVLLVFHQWLGRLPGLRWLHHGAQPRLIVAREGLQVRLPDSGERVHGWDDVTGLRSRPLGGADLLGRDGVVLVRIPESLVLAAATRWRAESVASAVVRVMPNRYRLSGANWAGVPNEFSLRGEDQPLGPADPWATRRRTVNVAIWLAFAAATGYIVIRWLML